MALIDDYQPGSFVCSDIGRVAILADYDKERSLFQIVNVNNPYQIAYISTESFKTNWRFMTDVEVELWRFLNG